MKSKLTLLLILFTLAAVITFLPGCGTTTAVSTNGQSVTASVTNDNVGVTGTYDTATGEWTAGILITFPKAPTPEVIQLLSEAGAVAQRGAAIFLLPKYDRLNIDQQVAIEAALRAGATLKQAN